MKRTNHEKKHSLCKFLLGVVAIAVLTLPGMAIASDIGSPDPEVVKGLYPG
jgi:hypothetical protein